MVKLFRHPCFKIILKVALLLSTISFVSADNDKNSQYHWGRGLNLPALGLTLGGYTDMSFKSIHNRANKVALDDLSLFVTWDPLDRLHFFSETEFEDSMNNLQGIVFSKDTLRVERLYVDLLADETTQLRVGKFLTPVGIWNTTHVAPLVWTSSSPIAADDFLFPSHASGLQLTRHFILNNHNLSISLYADDSLALDVYKNNTTFKNALGTQIKYELTNHLRIGFSYLNFKNKQSFKHSHREHLFGLDWFWKKGKMEIQSEFVFRHGNRLRGDETALYVQSAVPLVSRFYLTGRYEFYDTLSLPPPHVPASNPVNVGLIGLAWRPSSPLIIKVEYRFGSHNYILAPDGFSTSIATFF